MLLFVACDGGSDSAGVAEPRGVIPAADARQLGTVHFPTSCNQAAHRQMQRGLALLHHMTYEEARQSFAAAADADSECGMAYWGMAMTYIHPLWPDVIPEQRLRQGWELVSKARATGDKTDRELAYIDAIEAYYADGLERDESTRLASFAEAWRQLHESYPDDVEAAAFYSLAHMATAAASDKSYEKQMLAGRIAEQVLAQVPDHPGGHHYVIHAYDSPPLAERALEVARNYGNVAPNVPHALHMPSHIFTRLGLWQESIAWNRRAADAARLPTGEIHLHHHLHALDYLVYAYLQGAQDRKAEEVLRGMDGLEPPFDPHPAVPYTFAAVPARLALERQRWQEAAAIQPRQPSAVPWNRYPQIEAISHFARALGAARNGDPARAREALQKLGELHERVAASTAPYDWASQVEIQRLTALAWLTYEEGDTQRALALMREAADLESSTEKSPVTPGEVLPARELLGDMLRELGRNEEALAEYEVALDRSPGRFNSLYGAGRAAALAGDTGKAAAYYRQLLENCRQTEAQRPRLQRAKAFLAES
ncbi:MAG: tetratricopeptide repeat protein [Myxococcota bacterium]